ncbi:MAG: ABC transporter substrate-binding protein, partial [Dehalococcoidia bacterium]|nr:ABC transporter substrate-binding protein [Dehalococcoidia bacterium]
VKIGFINPLTGPLAPYGFLERLAVNMAMEDVNASGGINGSPLQLVTDDSPFDPKQAVTVVRKQTETDKVFGIVGPYSSGEMEVAAPLANQLQIVVASGSSTKVGVAEANRPWAFQMNVPDAVAQPVTIAAYKKLYPNVKNLVLVGDTKNAVTQAMMVDQFPKLLPAAGFTVVDTIAFDTGVTDFSAIVTKIKNAKPDGIVVATLQTEALGLAKEFKTQGITAPVMTDAHPIGGPVVELAGGSVDGWVMPSLFDWQNPDPKVAAWVKRYYDKAAADSSISPKPNHLVVEATYYDTVMIMADIMRKAGVKATTDLQTARKAILDGFTNLKGYQGIGGPMNMLPSGNAERVAPPPFVVDKGTYKVLR